MVNTFQFTRSARLILAHRPKGAGCDELELILALQPMTENQFFEFCQRNKDLRIERTAQGEIIVMPPVGFEASDRELSAGAQLRAWAKRDGRGRASGATAGFILPNGAVRSADAAWISRIRLASVPRLELAKFPHLCPEFVIEVRSQSDSLRALQAKMQEWIDNGAELGWLIDPAKRVVYEYTRDGVRRFNAPSRMKGHGPIAGFTLDLREIWEGL